MRIILPAWHRTAAELRRSRNGTRGRRPVSPIAAALARAAAAGIVAAVAGASVAAARAETGFPAVDVPKLCSGASVFGPRDKAVAVCLRDERQARDRLRALWPHLRQDDRALCLGDAELGVARDYVDIVGCIDMNRELRRENGLPPDRALPPQ